MITKFEKFLNESDDIKKRLLQRIENTFKQERDKHGIEHPIKKDINIGVPKEPNPENSEYPEPKMKPELSEYGDSRLDQVFKALINLYNKKDIENYFKNIEKLTPYDTVDSLVYWGIRKIPFLKK